jgi:hypothetical protein
MQSKGGFGRFLHYCRAATVSFWVLQPEEETDVILAFRRIAVIVVSARAQNPVTGDRLPETVQKGFKRDARHCAANVAVIPGCRAGSLLYPNGLVPRGEPKPGQRFKIVH